LDGSVNGDFLRLKKGRRRRRPAAVCLCRPMESSGEAAFEFCGRSRGAFLQIEFARAAPVVDVDLHFQRRTGAFPRSALRLWRRPFVLPLANRKVNRSASGNPQFPRQRSFRESVRVSRGRTSSCGRLRKKAESPIRRSEMWLAWTPLFCAGRVSLLQGLLSPVVSRFAVLGPRGNAQGKRGEIGIGPSAWIIRVSARNLIPEDGSAARLEPRPA